MRDTAGDLAPGLGKAAMNAQPDEPLNYAMRATSTRNSASYQGGRSWATLSRGSCPSRLLLLRNVRVAGVRFLISVTVRGAGGYGVKRPNLHDDIASGPRRCNS